MDSISQWLSAEELNGMFAQNRPNNLVKKVNPSIAYLMYPKAIWPQYFYGFDLGLKNDAAAVAICHWETNELLQVRKLVFDYVDRRKAGEGAFAHKKELSGDDIIEWLYQLSQIYPIADGVYDQWSGTLFGQLLQKKNIRGLRMESFTESTNSLVYLSFRALSLNQELSIPTLNNKDLENEIQLLQCEIRPGNRIKVEAPHGAEYHDDRADAIARSCWVAQEFLNVRPEGKAPSHQVTLVGTVSGSPSYMKDQGAISRYRRSAMSDPRSAAKLMAIKRNKTR